MSKEFVSILSLVSNFMTIFLIAGFMPLSVISYFSYQRAKKDLEFKKTTAQMQMSTSKTVLETFSNGKYFLPVGFATLVCVLGITLISFSSQLWLGGDAHIEAARNLFLFGAHFMDDLSTPEAKKLAEQILGQNLTAFAFAFIGGFLWSAMTIIRRLIANDLPPNVYYTSGLRMMLAISLAIAGSYILNTGGDENFLKSSLPMIAFLVGMFPERFLDFFINKYKQWMMNADMNTRVLSLENIEGISMAHRERLEEIEIDNAQNLSNAGLSTLMLETPYEARLLIDWMGQAKLLCLVKEKIDNLRSIGIRTVYDLRLLANDTASIQKIATAANVNPVMLGTIFNEVSQDFGIDTLHTFLINLNTLSDQSKQDAPVSNIKNNRVEANRPQVNIGALSGADQGAYVAPVVVSNAPQPTSAPTNNTSQQPSATAAPTNVPSPVQKPSSNGGAHIPLPPVSRPTVTQPPVVKNPNYSIPDNIPNDIPAGVPTVDLPGDPAMIAKPGIEPPPQRDASLPPTNN